jgi:hypothetical protein
MALNRIKNQRHSRRIRLSKEYRYIHGTIPSGTSIESLEGLPSSAVTSPSTNCSLAVAARGHTFA